MHRFFLVLLLVLGYNFVFAQLFDDFSDGNLDQNPQWFGDIASFIVNPDKLLQLDHPLDEGANKNLHTPVVFPDSIVWTLDINLNFNPSINNQLRVYLMSDNIPENTNNGYFIEIGENGSEDAIQFFKLKDGIASKLIDLTQGQVAEKPDFSFMVTRTIDGTWTFYSDYNKDGLFDPEGEIQDSNILPETCSYFAIHTKFSKSNRNQFFFDNIRIAPLLPDITAPSLVSYQILSENNLLILFDEALNKDLAETTSNFTLSGLGEPKTAILNPDDPREIELTFQQSMQSGSIYVLEMQNLEDLSGNIISPISIQILYILEEDANAYELIINEINATTKGTLAVPNVEYVEIYNRSEKHIQLQNYSLSSGGSPRFFPAYTLSPNSYLLICDKDDEILFSSSIPLIGLESFPQLTDGEDLIELRDAAFNIIDAVSYTRYWHDNDDYFEAGYSLERINPNLPCETYNNWASCRAIEGGTPGAKNNVYNVNYSGASYEILEAIPQSENELLVLFSHKMSSITIENPDYYEIIPAIDIKQILSLDEEQLSVLIQLDQSFEESQIYEVIIGGQFLDCDGLEITKTLKKEFGIPAEPLPGDIVFSEILFDPLPGNVDYIEIYNNSSKFFDLSKFSLSNSNSAPPDLVSIEESRLFYPGEYIAFSENPFLVALEYQPESPDQIISQDLPNFSDENGNSTLYFESNGNILTLDSFDYDVSLHNALISDSEGVSLEKIRLDGDSNDANNWTSASSLSRYGTPGYVNSQRENIQDSASVSTTFWMENRRFSPDNDGFEDVLFLNYKLNKPGYLASIEVYNSEGYHINKLTNNLLLGSEGFIRWDGQDKSGQKALMGIYLVYIKLIHPDGDTVYEKHSCILAAKL